MQTLLQVDAQSSWIQGLVTAAVGISHCSCKSSYFSPAAVGAVLRYAAAGSAHCKPTMLAQKLWLWPPPPPPPTKITGREIESSGMSRLLQLTGNICALLIPTSEFSQLFGRIKPN